MYLIGETVVQSSAFLAGGITAKGYVPARSNDEFGFGLAAAINGNHYLEAERRAGRAPADAEVAIALPYLAALTSWLSLEPDLQYVINPNTDSRLHNGLRRPGAGRALLLTRHRFCCQHPEYPRCLAQSRALRRRS